MVGCVCGPEIADVGVMKSEGGVAETEKEGAEERGGVGGVWPDVALFAVIRARRAKSMWRIDWRWRSRPCREVA